jgi:hypothetical protein
MQNGFGCLATCGSNWMAVSELYISQSLELEFWIWNVGSVDKSGLRASWMLLAN